MSIMPSDKLGFWRWLSLGLTLVIIIAAVTLFVFFENRDDTTDADSTSLSVNGRNYRLLVPRGEKAYTDGLSIYDSMPADSAMIFVTPNNRSSVSLWMKNMKFPIDIIWLDATHKVVHLEKNISPDTFPRSFRPPDDTPGPIAIEFAAGTIDEIDIKLDQSVEIRNLNIDDLPNR